MEKKQEILFVGEIEKEFYFRIKNKFYYNDRKFNKFKTLASRELMYAMDSGKDLCDAPIHRSSHPKPILLAINVEDYEKEDISIGGQEIEIQGMILPKDITVLDSIENLEKILSKIDYSPSDEEMRCFNEHYLKK